MVLSKTPYFVIIVSATVSGQRRSTKPRSVAKGKKRTKDVIVEREKVEDPAGGVTGSGNRIFPCRHRPTTRWNDKRRVACGDLITAGVGYCHVVTDRDHSVTNEPHTHSRGAPERRD